MLSMPDKYKVTLLQAIAEKKLFLPQWPQGVTTPIVPAVTLYFRVHFV